MPHPSQGKAYLDAEGVLLEPPRNRQPERWVEAYRLMSLTRALDYKAVALQRTGQLGTFASTLGQEAIGAAIGLTMADDDVFAPYYRDLAAQIARGVAPHEMFQYWGGDERGNDFAHCPSDFPWCVPIATQSCHAAGAATAFRIRGEKRVAVTTCGDGGTSKGDFLESLNVAGVWRLPMVFVIINNQWAISVPRHLQSSVPALADKAQGAGLPGIQVDGNDLLAMMDAMQEALARARAGRGATVIEAVTYRLCDHTTADDASRYREEAELKAAWAREPLSRLRNFLVAEGLWDERREQALAEQIKQQVNAAVETYLNTPPAPATAMFDHLFAERPTQFDEQYALLEAMDARHEARR